jgi:plastocyanin
MLPRRARLVPVVALLVCLAAAGPAAAAQLGGTVQLLAKDGRMVDRAADVTNAVVAFWPRRAVQGLQTSRSFTMATEKKAFAPRVLAVPVGSTVAFPNRDPILHNVFSISGDNRFDLGLYRRGDGKTATFQHAGLVRIFCNIHHSMVAYVRVLDTPYFTAPDATGRFVLGGLPEGPGRLEVWHEQTDDWSSEVAGGHGGHGEPLAVRLEVTKPRVPPHLNKVGRAYTKRGDDY